MTRRATIPLVFLMLVGTAVSAQTPDFSGTWKLNRDASTIDTAVPYSGLGGNAGVPTTLYATHARNGTLIVGSDMNTSHARTYRPGGQSTAPLAEGGEVVMRSAWSGDTLVSEGTDDASQSRLREALTRNGDSLTVVITISTNDDTKISTLIYGTSDSEPPCRQWSTPCKTW